jgi:hypothetical protein
VEGQSVLNVTSRTAGFASDPAGDAGTAPQGLPTPDLISATATVSRGELLLSVRFAQGAFDPAVSRVHVSLDTDLNAATGHPGLDSNGSLDTAAVGVDYLLLYGPGATPGALYRYAGPPINTFAFVAAMNVTVRADGVDVTIPLSAIGNDDGLLRVKLVSSVALPGGGGSAILDVLPNVGLPAIVTVPP